MIHLLFWMGLWLLLALLYGAGQAFYFHLVKTLSVVTLQACLVYFNLIIAAKYLAQKKHLIYVLVSVSAIVLSALIFTPLQDFFFFLFFPKLQVISINVPSIWSQGYWKFLSDATVLATPFFISTAYILVTQKSQTDLKKGDESATEQELNILYLQEGKSMHRIDLNSVIFIEGMKEYVRWNMPNTKLVTLHSLRYLEDLLASKGFIRLHRSYIVNSHLIDVFKPGHVFLGDQKIPIGRSYRSRVNSVLQTATEGL